MLDIMLMADSKYTSNAVLQDFEGPLKKVVGAIMGIVSVVGAVCVAICLLGMLFSKNPKTVEEYKTWLKRVIVCWIALLLINTIVEAVEGLIPN